MEKNNYYARFLDRSILPEEEDKLFAELSYNHVMREELHQYINLNNTFKSASKSYIPSNEAISNIYSAIGLSLPAFSAGNPLPQMYSFVKSKAFTGIVSAIIASLLTVMIFILQDNPFIIQRIPLPGIEKTFKPLPEPGIKTVGTENELHNIRQKSIVPLKLYKPINIIDTNERNISNITEDTKSGTNTGFLLTEHFVKSGINVPIERHWINNTIDMLEVPNPANFNTNYTFNEIKEIAPKMFTAEIRGAYDRYLPKETIGPSYYPLFKNMGLSLMTSLNEDIKLGLDIRQENFSVVYHSKDTSGAIFKFEQLPNLISCGVLARINLFNEFYGLQPYCQAMISGNLFGLVGRANIGFEFNLIQNFNLVSQLEYSGMVFEHQSILYITSKLSMNYGVNYNF